MAEADKESKARNLLKYCQLPDHLAKLTFSNFIMREGLDQALDASWRLAEGKGIKWLTLLGLSDMGKSHLAAAVVNRWLERGIPARYALVPQLLDNLRRGYRDGADTSYEQVMDFYTDVPLLILDDLGMEAGTSWAMEKLDTIVELRAAKGLHLMVTTNKAFDELAPRIASRLQRFQPGECVAVVAPEYRVWAKDQ